MSGTDNTTDTEPLYLSDGYRYIKEDWDNPNLSQEINSIIQDGINNPEIIFPTRACSGSSTKRYSYGRANIAVYQPQAKKVKPLIENSGKSRSGRYGFKLHFPPDKKKPSKSCPFTYSPKLNKIFCRKGETIVLQFQTAIQLPSTSSIRAYLTFKGDEHDGEIVPRCPFHVKQDKSDGMKKDSVIQDVDESSSYVKCPSTGHVIINNVNHVSSGKDKLHNCKLKMMCASTCLGGINRRLLVLVLCLYIQDRQEGQINVDIQCCSCPGRDRTTAEAKAEATENTVTNNTTTLRKHDNTTNKMKKENVTTSSTIYNEPKRMKVEHFKKETCSNIFTSNEKKVSLLSHENVLKRKRIDENQKNENCKVKEILEFVPTEGIDMATTGTFQNLVAIGHQMQVMADENQELKRREKELKSQNNALVTQNKIMNVQLRNVEVKLENYEKQVPITRTQSL